ncbi:sensor histidine kinase [Granulosicoccus antarcticus]|uniref:histidine kinase n=1 Tax=Granulosicoccus antarcticus IMCC3135 TaxID=1192854 RepID=A0A2Z2NLH6_9GAMM|nr:HAMP domain-containing sensor histidine kinase [Granulosicoccus antarcticus]ASJ71385.1 Sensor histidine kinase CpxA [Granulosicoccus antarcticus IMCC3135]
MIKALSSSLSLRLLGIFIVTSALVIMILVTLFSRGLSGQWVRSIRPHLVQYIQYVEQDLGSPPEPDKADAIAGRLPVDIHIYRQDILLHATTESPLDVDDLEFEPVGKNRKKHLEAKFGSDLSRITISPRGGPQQVLRIRDGEYTIYFDLRTPSPRHGRFNDELLLALAALAIVLTSSYLLIRRQLSPIRQIKKSVGLMSDGNLNHRIARRGRSDLDNLANSIDAMAARLQAILDAKRQLLISVSHELRSPITRARINTELLPDSRIRDRLQDDLADMERMIRDIMESEQLQNNHSVLNTESLDLNQLFRNELEHIAPGIELQVAKEATSLLMIGDAARLRILLRNLVLNALQHGKNDDGTVSLSVSLEASADRIRLTVSDQGPGISREHLDDVVTPFYRPDPSRSRETGGFGLGLTLARLVAEAHDGTLSIDSDPSISSGTRVLVELPCR